MSDSKLILVTGATGYVGGRLVPRLLAAGYQVRCLVRDPARLQGRAWLNQVELVQGDMFQPDSLVAAMRGVRTVYYLVHSLGGGSDFSERDLLAARNCASAAKQAGVERIIYLGGLGDPQAALSPLADLIALAASNIASEDPTTSVGSTQAHDAVRVADQTAQIALIGGIVSNINRINEASTERQDDEEEHWSAT